jgi:peptidoglycan/LPS O-acetylase OafA/YrhL
MLPSTEERPNLDILRAFAVTAVLIDHLVPTLEYHVGYHFPLALLTEHIGHWGVMAFFVHTTLVLMHSLGRLERAGPTAVTRRFLLRRAFRIYPLSILCVAVAVFLAVPAVTWGVAVPSTWQVRAANVLLVQNFWTKKSVIGPLWSLPYEVQMYLVLPVLHRFARRWAVAGILVLLVAAIAAGATLAVTSGHLGSAAYIPCFLAGALCFALEKKQHELFPASWWPPFLLVLALLFCAVNIDAMRPIFWVSWVICLVLAASINVFRESTSRRFNAVAKTIAQYSYGLYLWHVPVLHLVFGVVGVHSPLAGTLLFLPLTLAAAILSYHLVEAPLVAVGRKL